MAVDRGSQYYDAGCLHTGKKFLEIRVFMKTKRKPDKYDREIARLSTMPIEDVRHEWKCYRKSDRPDSPLFNYATPDGRAREGCGCLTTIRSGTFSAWTASLTRQIRADKRIPKEPYAIFHDDLPVFAEWQRKLDRLIRRKKKAK